MEVLEIHIFDSIHKKIETIDDERRDLIVSNLAINVVHLNSMGRIVTNLKFERRHIGNRMECAFLEFLSKNGVDYQEIRKNSTEIQQTNPSEERRIVVTVAEHPEDPNLLRVYANGSTDVFLTRCNQIMIVNGQTVPFTYSKKKEIQSEVIQKYQKKRLRVLALGYKDITKEDYYRLNDDQNKELIWKHFVLVSLIALDDPTRGEEAQKAVSDCRKAGVNVRIISGDSTEATKAVARETGILWDFDEIWVNNVWIEGEEFRKKVGGIITHSRKTRWRKDYIKNENTFKEWIKDLKIISWSSSEHKYLLVTGLKNEGYTVGVTGITPADTKSLLKADIGLTLNQLGSEVAKHSSDAILQNDSLKSIVIGILWGRNLFSIIK